MQVKSTVKLNTPRIKQLTQAAVTALELTGELLHEETQRAQVFPFDTGNLQNESTFVDYSKSKNGKVTLVSSTPYARRLYYHPEYNFHQTPWTDESGKRHEGNANAKGRWLDDYLKGGKKQNFAKNAFAKLYKRNAGL